MYFNLFKKMSYVSSVLALSSSAYADTSYPLKTAISPAQADNIINAIQKDAGAPSGTQVTNTSSSGEYILNSQNFLTSIKIDALNFTVKVPVLFFTLTDDAHIQARADFPNGDCSKPANVIITETGNNSTVDGQIQKYLNNHSADLIKNYFIKMTNLANYCAIKPQLNHDVNFY